MLLVPADFVHIDIDLLFVGVDFIHIDGDLLLVGIDLVDVHVDLLLEVGDFVGGASLVVPQLLPQIVDFTLQGLDLLLVDVDFVGV